MDDYYELHNRFSYHPPRDEHTKKQHEHIRETLYGVAQVFGAMLPDSREKSLAITKLEETMFWANAAIARHSGDEKRTVDANA